MGRIPSSPAYAATASSIDAGFAAGKAVPADPTARPTALIAPSDLLVDGVIRAAEVLGLRVPEDVSVTGFDGIVVDGLAPYELTTAVQAAKAKGRAAGEEVGRMLDGHDVPALEFSCGFRAGNTIGPGGLSQHGLLASAALGPPAIASPAPSEGDLDRPFAGSPATRNPRQSQTN